MFSPRKKRSKKAHGLVRTVSDGIDNGFQKTSEKEVLEIDPANIALFSLPQEALALIPTEEQKVFVFKKGGSERKLHNNIELSRDELEKLDQLQSEAMKLGVPFYPCLTASATRFLGHCKGDVQKALDMMQATQAWRQTYFINPLRDKDLMDDLNLGIMYFVGRDSSLRPTMVFRARRIPVAWQKAKSFDQVMRLCLFCVEYFLRYMVVPGRVECFNVLVDLKDVGVSQIPVGGLKELSDKLGGHYVGRGGKFFICNMSRWLSPLVSVAKGVLSERRAQKMVFINKVEDFRQYFALHQLEEDLGGTMPMVDSFFPFPLPPGPFNAGYADGPAADAVAGVHEVLTPAGRRGRLWNPKLTFEENTSLEYSEKAVGILKACSLPVPPELIRAFSTVSEDDVFGAPTPESELEGNDLASDETIGSMIFNGEVLLSVEDAVPPRGRPRILEVRRLGQYFAHETRGTIVSI